MPQVVNEHLSVVLLGNLLDLQVTGPDPDEQEIAERAAFATKTWMSAPIREVTITCTLSVDDAMDLREEITAWLRSLGVED